MNTPNILIVDDHSIIRKSLALMIEHILPRCIIDDAIDGHTTLEMVEKKDYSLLLLDINLPDMDCFSLVETLLKVKPGLKILMFSMYPADLYARKFLQLGAMGYISKDAPTEEIRNAVLLVLDNKRYINTELKEQLLNDLNKNNKHPNPFNALSVREQQIARLLLDGNSPVEISSSLSLHTSTVGTHKARLMAKLDCHDILELVSLSKIYNFPS